MPYSKHKFDPDKLNGLPQAATEHLAEKHNGLIDELNVLPGIVASLTKMVETVIGTTEDEHAEMKTAFARLRAIIHFTSVKKLNMLGLTVLTWMATGIAEKFGINLKLIGPLLNKLFEHLAATQ